MDLIKKKIQADKTITRQMLAKDAGVSIITIQRQLVHNL